MRHLEVPFFGKADAGGGGAEGARLGCELVLKPRFTTWAPCTPAATCTITCRSLRNINPPWALQSALCTLHQQPAACVTNHHHHQPLSVQHRSTAGMHSAICTSSLEPVIISQIIGRQGSCLLTLESAAPRSRRPPVQPDAIGSSPSVTVWLTAHHASTLAPLFGFDYTFGGPCGHRACMLSNSEL